MRRVAQEREARSAAGERSDKTDERDVFEAQLFCADEKLPSGRQLDRVAANNLWRDAKHCLKLLRHSKNPFGPGLKTHCAHCKCRGNAGGSGWPSTCFAPRASSTPPRPSRKRRTSFAAPSRTRGATDMSTSSRRCRQRPSPRSLALSAQRVAARHPPRTYCALHREHLHNLPVAPQADGVAGGASQGSNGSCQVPPPRHPFTRPSRPRGRRSRPRTSRRTHSPRPTLRARVIPTQPRRRPAPSRARHKARGCLRPAVWERARARFSPRRLSLRLSPWRRAATVLLPSGRRCGRHLWIDSRPSRLRTSAAAARRPPPLPRDARCVSARRRSRRACDRVARLAPDVLGPAGEPQTPRPARCAYSLPGLRSPQGGGGGATLQPVAGGTAPLAPPLEARLRSRHSTSTRRARPCGRAPDAPPRALRLLPPRLALFSGPAPSRVVRHRKAAAAQCRWRLDCHSPRYVLSPHAAQHAYDALSFA